MCKKNDVIEKYRKKESRRNMNYHLYEIELGGGERGGTLLMMPDITNKKLNRGDFAARGFKILHRLWRKANKNGVDWLDIIKASEDAGYFFGGVDCYVI